MNEQRTVTDEELDLLAEGELSVDKRTDVFRRLDEQPWQWKNCALAILEAKALRDSLRGSLEEHPLSVNGREPTPEYSPLTETLPPAPQRQLTRHSSHHDRKRFGWLLAVSVLLAMTIGSLMGYRLGDSVRTVASIRDQPLETQELPTDLDEGQQSPMQAATQAMRQWLNVGDETLLAVVRLEDGEEVRLVPIVSSRTLADQLLKIPAVPVSPQQIQRANRAGWNILQHRQLIAIDRPEAEPEIVPVQMVRYKFAGREAI